MTEYFRRRTLVLSKAYSSTSQGVLVVILFIFFVFSVIFELELVIKVNSWRFVGIIFVLKGEILYFCRKNTI